MRLSAFSLLILLASGPGALADGVWYLRGGETPNGVFETGSGSTDGMTGSQATYLRGNASNASGWLRHEDDVLAPQRSFTAHGGLERALPLQAWRGKRVLLTVRLKNEAGARAYASVWIGKSNRSAVRSGTLMNRPASGWQTHSFVLDVPVNATAFSVHAGLTGKGTIWLDDVSLRAADRDMPVSWSERVDNSYGGGSELYPMPMILPGPGPVRPDEG